MMFHLLKKFLGVGTAFYPFESRVLEEVEARLNSGANGRLRQQIEAINKIQRLSDGKEVNLYRIIHGKPAFDDELRFPAAADELLLASVKMTGPDKHATLKVEVWLAKGRLFSLVFSKSPRQFFMVSNLKDVSAEITDVKIWLDPMLSGARITKASMDASVLTGWLREWQAIGLVADLHTPMSEANRAAYLARIDTQLPPDYIEFVAQTDGAKFASCVVYGLEKIRQIVLPETNYYILAELDGLGALAVEDGGRNAELYFLPYADNAAHAAGTSFQKAVTDLVGRDSEHVVN